MDPLATSSDSYSPAYTHLKTYTAGEDGSRLAAAAKELGLAQARQPRKQVRKSGNPNKGPSLVRVLMDVGTEDARMRSIYSQHDDDWLLPDRAQSAGTLGIGALAEIGEDDEGPISDGHEVVGGNLTAAVFGIVKGMVGPAILYLPHGFARAGYVAACPLLVAATCMFLYSSSCLLQVWRHETDQDALTERTRLLLTNKKPHGGLSYPELAYRALGPKGESLVKTGIALMQSGVCLTYLIFVPQNLHTACLDLTGLDVDPVVWLWLMIAVQVPLSWIRDIRKLTPTNVLANALILYGLSVCLGYAVKASVTGDAGGPVANWWQHVEELQAFAPDWFLFIGTSVLLFEGSITLLVPLQEAVEAEEDRKLFPVVYQRVILSIIGFYTVFGLSCWMAFGSEVQTVLTTSLPDSGLSTTVQLAYSLAVVFTFPLQNFPALEIACRTLRVKRSGWWQRVTGRNVLSSILVFLLALVAIATMESLDKVVSLMGSLLGCPIAFVFPPLIQSQLMWEQMSEKQKWLNRIVMGLGIVAMALASVTTIMTW